MKLIGDERSMKARGSEVRSFTEFHVPYGLRPLRTVRRHNEALRYN